MEDSDWAHILQKDPGIQKRFNFTGGCHHVLCHQSCKALSGNLKYIPQKKGNWDWGKSLEMRTCLTNCQLRLKGVETITVGILK